MGGDRRIRYARVNDADVAYHVSGAGPEDLLFIPGMLNHVGRWTADDGGSG